MHSPMHSPSLRAVSHIHPRTSYFNAPPSPPMYPQTYTTHTYIHSPRTVQPVPYASPIPSSPLVGCLKTPRRESEQITHHPTGPPRPEVVRRQSFHLDNRPLLTHQHHPSSPSLNRPQQPTRRNTLRQSAIPLAPGVGIAPGQKASIMDAQRRRPSFKIDLPPRAPPTSLETEEDVVGSVAPGPKGTPYLEHPIQMSFRDPFANSTKSKDYIILQPEGLEEVREETRGGGGFFDSFPSPTQCYGETLVGLGYSLNRMRAPTPWIREGGLGEGEWLTERDVEDMEGRMRGLGIA